MNNYGTAGRKRGQCLLIVEGRHEKDELFSLLFRCFGEINISADDIWIYGTNIYMLYDDIVREYGAKWEEDDIDLPFVISKKKGFSVLRYKEDFTNIILAFDYERHDTNFSEEKIMKMQQCFADAADMGKLYINYPMIESYQHICALPDKEFPERKIPVSLQPGREYKALVRRQSVIGKIIEFPYRIDDLLEERFEIRDPQLRKQCCDRIFAINTEVDIPGQIQDILKNAIKEKWLQTAKYQIEDKICKMGYFQQGKNFWQFLRQVFRQVILHNICKANRIQNNMYQIEEGNYKECFEQIDLVKILQIQNDGSRNEQTGFIWVLCTCVLFVAEYNFSLVWNFPFPEPEKYAMITCKL